MLTCWAVVANGVQSVAGRGLTTEIWTVGGEASNMGSCLPDDLSQVAPCMEVRGIIHAVVALKVHELFVVHAVGD